MKHASILLFTLLLHCSYADSITLVDGQVIKGKLVNRDDKVVTFKVCDQPIAFKVEIIKSVNLDLPGKATKEPEAGASMTAPKDDKAVAAVKTAPTKSKGTLPVGTRLVVRTTQALSSQAHKEGHKFTAALESDLKVGDAVVVKKGSTVYGKLVTAKKSRRLIGKSELTISFTDVLVDNQMVPMSTTGIKAVSEKTGRQSARRTLRGAAIGGLIDGKDGARTGAKVGAGVSVLTRGKQVNIPTGSLLEFTLSQPLAIK
jgi:hypothetical protein